MDDESSITVAIMWLLVGVDILGVGVGFNGMIMGNDTVRLAGANVALMATVLGMGISLFYIGWNRILNWG